MGAAASVWENFNAYRFTGLNAAAAPDSSRAAMPAIAGSAGPREALRPWHPESGLFWFGLILAATVGLIGVSTSFKVGPVRASASAGST